MAASTAMPALAASGVTNIRDLRPAVKAAGVGKQRAINDPGEIGAAAAEVAEHVRASVAEVRTRGGGAGAATIWRADGILITNDHVVSREHAEVTLSDGRTLSGSVIARDPRNDLAALQVRAHDLPAATLGDARALRVGELVLAVGHPFGIRGAVTVGVLSSSLNAADRRQARELVCADVLLGPGNSGGPLTDARGRVVGINAMVNGGLALAVPSHVATRLLAQPGGQPRLGIAAREVLLPARVAGSTLSVAGRVPDHVDGAQGGVLAVLVTEVTPSSAADRAGLLLGDALLSVNERPLDGLEGLFDALADNAGTAVRLGVLRGGAWREVIAPLGHSEKKALRAA